MELTFDQILTYFQHHHPGQKIAPRDKVSVRCRFHEDHTPSCTLFLSGNGGFHCNGCGAKGNVFQFETRIAGGSLAEAEARVATITGAAARTRYANLGPVIALYDYRDENGRTLFQKRRFEPEGQAKTFRIHRPSDSGSWIAGIDPPKESAEEPTRRILYNLPEVVTANFVVVCEGEKDCDNVSRAGLFPEHNFRIATTCNFDGAWKPGERPKWLASYNAYFAGKFVVIFQDNDAQGHAWASHVAESVYPLALNVKIVRLPGLAEKGDVSDWLQTHTRQDLEAEIARATRWRPAAPQRAYATLQDAVEFAAEAPKVVDWLVEGIVPAASNGIICGDPKASKSFHALDLAMSCACGVPWLGMPIPRRVKTALISREDSPGLTQRRIARLIRGRSQYGLHLPQWMLVNTRQHQADFKVTSDANLNELIEQLKRFGAEFVVLDVFRSLHDSEENDNTQVPLVLEKINRIQNECKCAVALVHHINKRENENIFRGLRGASAIHGWMEWGVAITVTNPDEEDKANYVRRLEFENKEATAPAIYSQLKEASESAIRIERVPAPSTRTRRGVTEITTPKAGAR
jgi:hypothetical protein